MGRKRRNFIDLPPRIQIKRGKYYHVDQRAGKSKWTFIGSTKNQAITEYARIEKKRVKEIPMLREIYYSTIRNAKIKGTEHSISFDDVLELSERANGECDISGIPFEYDEYPNAHRRPWVPSIDRIDSSLGYTKENCRLVCTAVNLAMNEWGYDVLIRIARYMRLRDRPQNRRHQGT